MRVLGIDPGSRCTGYGFVETSGNQLKALAFGDLRLGGGPLPGRLKAIFDGLTELIARHRPELVAVEQVFVSRNPASALTLGQARGAAICAAQGGLELAEYAPREIKLAVVGTGRADKTQVQHMVRLLLGLREAPAEDAADALACAICHIHSIQGAARLARRAGSS
jgi:crossover junction endodeoxyribonuclease RuvC